MLTPKQTANFFKKVMPEPNTGCWFWIGAQNQDGYGLFWVGDRSTSAHRTSYAMHVGPIPDDKDICHRCDQPSCVNPDHLFPGTHAENMRDMMRKGRGSSRIGEMNGHARLTVDGVQRIRDMGAVGYPPKHMAAMFGIHVTQVRRVIKRGTGGWQ
jgi:hypothetical protein